MQVSTKRGSSRGVKVENNYRDGLFSVQHWGIDLEQRESHLLLLLCLKRRRRRWKPWGPDGPRIPLVGHLLAPTFSLSLHFLYLSLSFPPSSSSYLRRKRRHLLTCFETKKFKPLNYIFWRTGENRLFWSFSSSSFFLFFFWSFQWCGPRFFVLPNWKNTFDSETFIYILCSHCIIIDSLPTWPNLINYDDELALFFSFFFNRLLDMSKTLWASPVA